MSLDRNVALGSYKFADMARLFIALINTESIMENRAYVGQVLQNANHTIMYY